MDAADSEGLTPTMWACYFDQLRNLQMLQNALARTDPEEDAIFRDTDCHGQSVIHWAVKGMGSLECLKVNESICVYCLNCCFKMQLSNYADGFTTIKDCCIF